MASISSKRALIDKANVTVVAVVAAAVFVTLFGLISTRALLSQRSYQQRVIDAREKARDQLGQNIAAADQLGSSYQRFVSDQENVIGGSSTGTGERDGDNARIVLDALPSKYDFPALTTSLEKLAKSQGLGITAITGVDDEVNQSAAPQNSSPQPIEMPFDITVSGAYDQIQGLVTVFEKSIRPFNIQEMTFTAGKDTSGLSLQIKAKTYYQPEKSLEFKSEVIR